MIIDDSLMKKEIEDSKAIDFSKVLDKAAECRGLTPEETANLFQNINKENIEGVRRIAENVRRTVKGMDASLYTCLYITNKCVNDCDYCGFKSNNKTLKRITLTPEQIVEEVRELKKLGHSNIILIGGTLPENHYKNLIIAATKILVEEGLNPWIEFENLSKETLKHLNKIGANHFILFQETYNKEEYLKLHKNSPLKRDYEARLRKMDEAIDAGFKNIGIGALFGLNHDYLFEILGLYHHTKHLQEQSVGVCISIPTLKNAPGFRISNPVKESEIEKIAITLRLALPEVSIALSGRETENVRNCLFPIIDHIGCGGRTNPGARTSYRREYERGDKQFELYDLRTPEEIKSYLMDITIGVKSQLPWSLTCLPRK